MPVVIAVNANQEIMDTACKLFASQFYSTLLQGFTIKESFDSASEHVRISECGYYETCCCAHAHKEDCLWYKLFKKDRIRAHEMHIKDCACRNVVNTEGGKYRRQHMSTCRQFREWLD